MMTSLETLKSSFALDIKLFDESVSRDIGTEGKSGKLMLIVIAALLCTTLKAFSQTGDKPTPPTPTPPTPTPRDTKRTLRLQIEVTSGDPPRKVEGAIVTVESEEGSAKYTKDAKTNKDGIVSLDHMPQGRVKIQVVAKEHDTFGEAYTLNKKTEFIKITLKKRSDQ